MTPLSQAIRPRPHDDSLACRMVRRGCAAARNPRVLQITSRFGQTQPLLDAEADILDLLEVRHRVSAEHEEAGLVAILEAERSAAPGRSSGPFPRCGARADRVVD